MVDFSYAETKCKRGVQKNENNKIHRYKKDNVKK